MTYREIPEIKKKYNCKMWQELRRQKLAISPLCERCLKKGIYTSAEIIHHKEYVTDKNYNDEKIFYNIENLESVCRSCHNEEHFAEKQEYEFDKEGNVRRKYDSNSNR